MADNLIPTTQREFRCNHCDGKILIPKDLPPTTGPCPHCAGVITSPDPDKTTVAVSVPVSAIKAPPAIPAAPAQAKDIPARTPSAPPPPPRSSPPPSPISAPPAVPIEASLPQKGPNETSGNVPVSNKVESRDLSEMIGNVAPPESTSTKKKAKPRKQKDPNTPKPHRSGLIPVMLVLLALILAGGGVIYFASQELSKNIAAPNVKATVGDPGITEANYIRIGWQKDAYQLLGGYMDETTGEGKIPYILNGEQLAAKIEDFYGGGVINDSDTPADGFSVYELSEADRKRGLFMMIYDFPPQFDVKEFFRPLASLEVQYGVDEADLLLTTLARVGNFAMEPLRVHAFFKRTSDGLKLDWEIFAQTKYRTFLNFVELPEPGDTKVFRVFVVEDVPEKGRAVAGTRTYRLVDPANTTDTARINVKVDSEVGRALSLINWRDTKESRPITKTATLKLKWTGEADAPELSISKFICWEFLGLGGQENPATASTK
jgi:hypothetical protein